MIIYNSELYHYGVPRRSGRYKWGSGKNPFHHGADAAFRKAKADYKANKKAINKEHRKSLRNVKDYRKVDSMVKNYKDAKRTNKEAYAQAKKAYKQTAEYKAARRKKIAGIAAGTTAVAATAYLAKHPEKRAQMSNMIKDITQGKYRPRDLSGVAKAGRPNPNLKYGRASYSKNRGLSLPAPANTLNGTKALRSGQTFKGNGRIERFYGPNYTSLTRKGPAGIRVQPPRYKRLDNALASGSKFRYATNVSPDHYKYDLKNNIHSGANGIKRLSSHSTRASNSTRPGKHLAKGGITRDDIAEGRRYRKAGFVRSYYDSMGNHYSPEYKKAQAKAPERLSRYKNSGLKATRRMRFDTRIEKVGIPSHRYKDPTGHSDVNTRTTTKYVPKRLAANKDKYGNYYLKQPGRSALRARKGIRRYKGKVNRRLR